MPRVPNKEDSWKTWDKDASWGASDNWDQKYSSRRGDNRWDDQNGSWDRKDGDWDKNDTSWNAAASVNKSDEVSQHGQEQTERNSDAGASSSVHDGASWATLLGDDRDLRRTGRQIASCPTRVAEAHTQDPWQSGKESQKDDWSDGKDRWSAYRSSNEWTAWENAGEATRPETTPGVARKLVHRFLQVKMSSELQAEERRFEEARANKVAEQAEAKIKAQKDEIERLTRELQEVKEKYFDQMKCEQIQTAEMSRSSNAAPMLPASICWQQAPWDITPAPSAPAPMVAPSGSTTPPPPQGFASYRDRLRAGGQQAFQRTIDAGLVPKAMKQEPSMFRAGAPTFVPHSHRDVVA